MNHETRRTALLLLPIALAALAAITHPRLAGGGEGWLPEPAGAPAAPAAGASADVAAAMQQCGERHPVAARPDAERQYWLDRQRADTGARSQSPAWLQRARVDAEHCLQDRLQALRGGARSGQQVAEPADAAVDVSRPAPPALARTPGA